MKCGVWGSPIEHSLSPVLHRAAYAALGLTQWSYERRLVDERSFGAALDALDEQWRGLSLTMPLKELALARADEASDTAIATGAANTLVREPDRWVAHNTDVHGIALALREAGCRDATRAVVIGSGATARSAVAALTGTGTEHLTFMVRGTVRPSTMDQARATGMSIEQVPLGTWPPADVVISTVPPVAVVGLETFPRTDHRDTASSTPTVLDVIYGDGWTPLQEAARAAGWIVAPGTSMLLHQAGEQVRLMTGHVAPLEAMRAALAQALGDQ